MELEQELRLLKMAMEEMESAGLLTLSLFKSCVTLYRHLFKLIYVFRLKSTFCLTRGVLGVRRPTMGFSDVFLRGGLLILMIKFVSTAWLNVIRRKIKAFSFKIMSNLIGVR